MMEFLKTFTGERSLFGGASLNNRHAEPNRELARRVLISHLRGLGLDPQLQTFETGANVIAEIQGSGLADEVVELAANFDSQQESPGADGNGTGIALLAHLAEKLVEAKPRRTIRFAFLDLGATKCDGACRNLIHLKGDTRKHVGSLIIESIGYA